MTDSAAKRVEEYDFIDFNSIFPKETIDEVEHIDFETMMPDLFNNIDKDIKWNAERGHYDFGPINWDEFWRVVGGNGPCNRERLAARNKAWDEGAWVREAALAYAEKQEALREAV